MTLANIYKEALNYLTNGVSVVPVRTKEEHHNGRVYGAKTPTVRWKQFQSSLINEAMLYDLMEKRVDDPAFAIICGQVSGSLELIDIDEKHDPGISAKYLSQIKEIYPHLYARLRIHRTPSGGYHILYRCEELLTDGNMKLAVPEGKKEACIETRGEGGYAVAPPSMGYEPIQNVAIPILSLSERNCLINLAKLYDSRPLKAEKTYTPTRRDNDFYDENPWEHFNNSPEAERLLCDFGWEFYAENKGYIHFTRPDKKTGVSASFIRDKKVFYVFTTTTELEGSKGYKPSTILSLLAFGGDKKKTYHALVERGYGRIKPKAEKQLIKASAAKGAPLPPNVSPSAIEEYKSETDRLKTNYPYGIFWSGDPIAGYKISREKVYQIAANLGYFVRGGDQVVKVDGHIAQKVDDRVFFDAIKEYIKEDEAQTQEDICNAYESFLQKSGKFTIGRLPIFNELLLLKSTKRTSYKFFQNCYLIITAESCKVCDYSNIGERLIWSEQVQPRDFKLSKFDNCLYKQYLDLAVENVPHTERCIGYLAHEYKDEAMAYIIVLTEAVPNPKDGGGSGKNIFCSLFSLTTTHKDVAGSQVQFNEKFLQLWNFERVFSISDAPKRFDFGFLKNISSNSAVLKRLYSNEISVSVEELPKMVVSTNYSFDNLDGGLVRRIIPIEFTDFFTRCGGVDVHFGGKMFPADWTDEDWLGFDNYMVYCIQRYLSNPKLKAAPLTDGGWQKQFDMNFGQMTRNFIEEYIESWKTKGFVDKDSFESNYSHFCKENGVADRYRVSSIKMNDALEEWCKKKGIEYERNYQKKVVGVKQRGRYFGEGSDEELPF